MPTDITTIAFPDRKTEKRAIRFLVGQFFGTVLRSSEYMPHKFIVPDTALPPLREAGIPFTSGGHSTLAERMEKLRGVDLVFNEGRPVPPAGLDQVVDAILRIADERGAASYGYTNPNLETGRS